MAGRRPGPRGRGGRKASAGNSRAAPQKRHQRQRGHPDPDAKIIALTPKALMDGKCFICTHCSKRFAREQNLVLHSRRHHLPSKLVKTSVGSPRKAAYVCPVATCRHHNPKRALSDITGIKKHFGRAHCMKLLACTRCDKRYAIKADLKAHVKLHHKDEWAAGAGCSDAAFNKTYVRAEKVCTEVDLAYPSGDSDSDVISDEPEEEEEADDAAAETSNNDGITQLSLGINELQDVYVPQFDVVPPVQEEREQGQASGDASATLDLDLELLAPLPMGLTGLLTGACAAPGNPEAPVAAAANSVPDLSALFAPAAAMATAASAGGLGGALPTVDLSLSFSPYGDHRDSNAINHGAGTLESLPFPVSKERYGKADVPASGHETSAAEFGQMTSMIGPNTSVTTPAALANAAAFQVPHSLTIPSMGNFYYPSGFLSQQAISTPSRSFSFAPFFGGAALGNANNHTMGGGSSDGFSGFFMGSANLNQGRDLGAHGSFGLGIPPVCAPQYQSPNLTEDDLLAPGLSYANILTGGAGAAAGRQMGQAWGGMQMGYGAAAPPAAAPELANQMLGNGAGGGQQGLDFFGGPSGEGPSRWFEDQGRGGVPYDPSASSIGDLGASFRYGGLQGGNPGLGGFW